MDNIILENSLLRVEISPQGAEIQRVRDRQGIERLWQGDAAFWAGRAPVLFPVAGALKDDRYTLHGQTYGLGKHGFARRRTFTVERQEATAASFVLTGEAGYDPGFPFDYALRVVFSLDDAVLGVTYTVENLGKAGFCYSTGAHEAYACPEGLEAYEVVFDREEPLTIGILEGSLLTRQTKTLPSNGNVLPLSKDLFLNDALVFPSLSSRGVTLRSRLHGRTVRVDFPDYPYLLLWTPVGAPFVCIEPWGNLPDYVDSDGDIAHKPGMVALAPGETHAQTHTIQFG